MRAHVHPRRASPADASLLRQWKRWEAGEIKPEGEFYKPIIAKTFGTVTHAISRSAQA